MILTDAELQRITKKQRFKAQAKELTHLKIPFQIRTDGSILVYLDDLVPQKAKPRRRPDFSVLATI